MDTEFLDPAESKIADHLFEKSVLNDLETWLRLWDKNTVQIDGDLTLPQLKELVRLMEELKTLCP